MLRKRIYHVITRPEGGTCRDESVCGSFDLYEQAKPVAQALYNKVGVGCTVLIRCQGVVVWSPYTKGEVV